MALVDPNKLPLLQHQSQLCQQPSWSSVALHPPDRTLQVGVGVGSALFGALVAVPGQQLLANDVLSAGLKRKVQTEVDFDC